MKYYEILKRNTENIRKGKEFHEILQNIKKSYEELKEI